MTIKRKFDLKQVIDLNLQVVRVKVLEVTIVSFVPQADCLTLY